MIVIDSPKLMGSTLSPLTGKFSECERKVRSWKNLFSPSR